MPHFKSLPCAATNVNLQLVSNYKCWVDILTFPTQCLFSLVARNHSFRFFFCGSILISPIYHPSILLWSAISHQITS